MGLSGEQMSRVLGFLNNYELGASMVGEVAGTVGDITLVFHPGSNPKDPFDASAVIPAQELSQLQIKCTTCANDTIDDTLTISSATGYLTVWEIIGVPTPVGIMTPVSSTLSYAHSADYSDLSKKIDVPTGAWLRRILMLVQDETATLPVRKNDEVTAVSLELPKTGKKIFEARIADLLAATACRYGTPPIPYLTTDAFTADAAIPDGFAIIDMRSMSDPLYGLDLTQYVGGDIKLGLTIENYASGDDTIIVWDQLIPFVK